VKGMRGIIEYQTMKDEPPINQTCYGSSIPHILLEEVQKTENWLIGNCRDTPHIWGPEMR
jgi:hypothetical protein